MSARNFLSFFLPFFVCLLLYVLSRTSKDYHYSSNFEYTVNERSSRLLNFRSFIEPSAQLSSSDKKRTDIHFQRKRKHNWLFRLCRGQRTCPESQFEFWPLKTFPTLPLQSEHSVKFSRTSNVFSTYLLF